MCLAVNKALPIWIYKRSHDGDPDNKTGIFGNNDCGQTHRDQHYDAVIGMFGTIFGGKDKVLKINWIGSGASRIKLGNDAIDALSKAVRSLPAPWGRDWKGIEILAFDNFLYFENGADFDTPCLVNRMLPVRTGGMMSPNLAEPVQREVDKIIRYANENGKPSPCLEEFKSLRNREQSSVWIGEMLCLLGYGTNAGARQAIHASCDRLKQRGEKLAGNCSDKP
jgi:hypothetical protein